MSSPVLGSVGVGLLLLVFSAAHAQTYVAEGRVLDSQSNEALVGVNVLVEGTTLGTVTDNDGRFLLTASERFETLTFSYLGYQTATVVAGGSQPIVVHLTAAVSDLQPVVVSGSRVAESRTEVPMAIATLTAADLDATKPDLLAQALNRVPGVHMVDLGNEQHAMSIRQPFSLKPLYLYLEDGIPIRPIGIFNHNALIEMNQAGLERIEVVRGPGSALYGADAIGGAVNFITAPPTSKPSGGVRLRGGGYGYGRADLQAAMTTGRLGLVLGGYGTRQRDGRREHSDYDKLAGTLRADYAFAPNTRFTATAGYNYLDTDTDGSLDSLNFFGQGYSSLQTFTYRKVDAFRGAARLDQTWSAQQRSQVAVFVRSNSVAQLPHYRLRSLAGSATDYSGEINDNAFRSVGMTGQHEAYLGTRVRLVAGGTVDFSPASYVAEYIAVSRDADSERFIDFTPSDSLLTDYDVDLLNTAAFAQVEVEPIQRLKLVGSLRYDRIRYGFDNHLAPGAFSGAPDATDRFDRLTPRLGVVYAFDATRGVYANVSQGFQPPEVGELYEGVQVPVLQPAVFDSYEVGGFGGFLNGRLYLDASLYRMNGTNEIISVRQADGSSENRNAGETRHEGIEYALTLRPSAEWALRFGGTNARHTYLRFAVDEREGRELVYDGNRMEAAPAFLANGEVAYTPAFVPGARLAVEAQRVGGYWMDPANIAGYDGHTVVNLRGSYHFHGALNGIEVWASVLNMTDELYATNASLTFGRKQYTPGQPRSFTIGLGYRLGR